MKIIDEEIKNFDKIDDKQAALDPVTADAIAVSAKKEKEIEKELKKADKLPKEKPFLGDGKNNKKTFTNQALKKMHLSEDLFEGITKEERRLREIDKSIVANMKEIKGGADEWLDFVLAANQDSYTDSILRTIIKDAKDIETLQKEYFNIIDGGEEVKEDLCADDSEDVNYIWSELEEMCQGDYEYMQSLLGHIQNRIDGIEVKDESLTEGKKDLFDTVYDELIKLSVGTGRKNKKGNEIKTKVFSDEDLGSYIGEDGEEGIKVTSYDKSKLEKAKEIASKHNLPIKELSKKDYSVDKHEEEPDEEGNKDEVGVLNSKESYSVIIITNRTNEELMTTSQKIDAQKGINSQEQDNDKKKQAFLKAKQGNFQNKQDVDNLEKELGL